MTGSMASAAVRRPVPRRSPRQPAALAFLAGLLLLPVSLADPAKASPPVAGSAALIYAGWYGNTIPTPSFVSANLAFLKTQPFDGLVVYLRDPGLTFNVTTKTITTTPVTYDKAMEIMAPLVGLSLGGLTQNLGLIQGSTPPDFFDDWSVPIQNFANVAKAAKDSGLKGLCFDNEQYSAPWGNYGSNLKYYSTKTFAEYQAQARLRGKQIMEAMVAQFPDIVFLTLHGPYISEPDAPSSLQFPQWQSGNELLGPFFAGHMEAAGDTACNMDGGELYTLRTSDHFQASYTWRRDTMPSDAVNCAFIPASLRTVWPSRTSISYGVYDKAFGGAAMDANILRTTLANAMKRADRYVWFYAEAATYLLPPALGGAGSTWVNAIAQARIDAGAGSDPEVQSPLGTPANLAGQAVSTTEISLTWQDQSSAENGFSIERLSGSTWSQVGTVAANVTTFTHTGLAAGTSYSYRVLAFNATGNSPTSNVATVTTPASSGIPGAPSNLAVVGVTTSSVALSWTDGSSNENGFSIERLIGSTWTQVGWVGANLTTFTNSGLSADTSYSYRVLAFNGYGNSSTTNVVNASTSLGSQVPAAPSNLAVAGTSSSSVTLSWTDGSSNENGFSIERLIGSTWTQVGWVADNVTTFTNTGLAEGTSYSYRVLAFNGYGNSPTTNVVSASTGGVTAQSSQTAPAAPTNLTAVAASSTTVNLAWTDASSNEGGFRIYRKKQGNSWSLVADLPANATSYQDTGRTPGSSYTYRMRSYNSAGQSSFSNDAKLTMPTSP